MCRCTLWDQTYFIFIKKAMPFQKKNNPEPILGHHSHVLLERTINTPVWYLQSCMSVSLRTKLSEETDSQFGVSLAEL